MVTVSEVTDAHAKGSLRGGLGRAWVAGGGRVEKPPGAGGLREGGAVSGTTGATGAGSWETLWL